MSNRRRNTLVSISRTPSPEFIRASRIFYHGSCTFLRACHIAKETDRIRAQRRALRAAFFRDFADPVRNADGAAPPPLVDGPGGSAGMRLPEPAPAPALDPPLPRRLQETLDLLLAGQSEKQVAARLGISYHTVHEYVKILYKRFRVASRSQLLALFLQRSQPAAGPTSNTNGVRARHNDRAAATSAAAF
jgi:DNA-binding CsgD family transcriptional regulator